MSEVVKDGETGFVINSKEEMVEAVLYKVQKIKRSACREHVDKNFAIQKMVDTYEKVYEKIISEWKN